MILKKPMEMVVCPICHQPFPKLRRDLGYKCCVSCSTESAVVCFVEGIPEEDGGDGVYDTVTIVSREEAKAVDRARGLDTLVEGEDGPDMAKTEDIEEFVSMSYDTPISIEDLKSGYSEGTAEDLEKQEQLDIFDLDESLVQEEK